MYNSKTSNNVIELMNMFNIADSDNQIYFIKYVLKRFDNNQVNEKNITNPSLLNDEEELEIFSPRVILWDNNIINKLIEYINIKTNILNHFYQKNNKLLSLFERLKYKEKVDIIMEIILYLENKDFLLDLDGYAIARRILNYKN